MVCSAVVLHFRRLRFHITFICLIRTMTQSIRLIVTRSSIVRRSSFVITSFSFVPFPACAYVRLPYVRKLFAQK